MPRYDYQCPQCQTIFEVRATIKEKEAGLHPACPQCQCAETRQRISAGMVLHAADGSTLSLPSCGPDAGPGCCG